jgi:peptide methionine sulfoxide reductase MsrB
MSYLGQIFDNELNNRKSRFCISATQLMILEHQLTVMQTILETMTATVLHIKEKLVG